MNWKTAAIGMLAMLACAAGAQRFQVAGTQRYAHSSLFDEELYSQVKLDAQGNVFAAGLLMTEGKTRVLISKFGPTGLPLWHRLWGEISMNMEVADLAINREGQAALLVRRVTSSTVRDSQVRLYAGDGSVRWTFSPGASAAPGGSLKWAPNGDLGYMSFWPGSTRFGVLTPAGAPRWTRSTGQTGVDLAFDPESRLILAGAEGYGDTSLFVDRYNAAADRIGHLSGNPTPNTDVPVRMLLDSSGAVFLLSASVDGNRYTLGASKFGPSGLEWTERYAALNRDGVFPIDMALTPNGSLYVLAGAYAGDRSFEILLRGSYFGGPLTVASERPKTLQFADLGEMKSGPYGELYVSGYGDLEGATIRSFNPLGAFLWEQRSEVATRPAALAVNSNGEIFAATSSISPETGSDPTLYRLIQAPVAITDSFVLIENTPLLIASESLGVLANDRYARGAQSVLLRGSEHGNTALNSNGIFTYNPTTNFRGADSFRYRAQREGMGSEATVNFTVLHTVRELAFDATMGGGLNRTGIVRLSGPAATAPDVVTLRASGPISCGPSVSVPVGESSAVFAFTTLPVTSNTVARITATLGSRSVTRDLTIVPAGLIGVGATPTVVGSLTGTGELRMNGLPTSDQTVTLASSNGALRVPASVLVPRNAQSWGFEFTTTNVSIETDVTITASLGGASRTCSVRLLPVRVSGFLVDPGVVRGGIRTSGIVKITGKAPEGGLTMSLSDNSTYTSVPATLTILAGQSSASFYVYTAVTTVRRESTITLTNGSLTYTCTVALNPN